MQATVAQPRRRRLAAPNAINGNFTFLLVRRMLPWLASR